MTLTEAICSLREHSGKSQQIFATALGMSVRGYARYEAGKTPEPSQLIALMTYAHYAKLEAAYQILYRALVEQLRPPPGFRLEITLKISKLEKKREAQRVAQPQPGSIENPHEHLLSSG